ncbi:FadR/GntR family transcriptional regulator [Frankia canadensis]|uniref:FadR/GntR family transcriptional regulator n=1 Tax=Frankia canadensis TaxID=1836972 RepID=UPI001FAF0EED|nr:GntR family transcriptional regulator [Frankia canadensis]
MATEPGRRAAGGRVPGLPGSPAPLTAGPLAVTVSPVGRQVRVPKTAELVASQLRRRIIRGELSEGDALPPEPTLMTQFGVSRPTLREAFRVLEAEALISVRRGAHGGARVHAPSPNVAARYAGLVLEHRGATLGDVHQASSVIEPPCAVLLAERGSPDDVAALRAVLAEGDSVGEEPAALAAAQAAFHRAVVELTGNKSLSVLTGMLQHLVELTSAPQGHASIAANIREAPARSSAGDEPQRRPLGRTTRLAHATLIDLIERGDAAGAGEHWGRHLAAPGHAVPGGPADGCVLDLLG